MIDITPEILDFWFGSAADNPDGAAQPFWFKSTAALDQEIRTRFVAAHESARNGAFDATAVTSDDHLAVVLILDQFSRNMFRGTPAAFACDPAALDWARKAVAMGLDQAQPPPHRRMFFYLPFEHSENLADQDESVRLFEKLGHDEYTRHAIAHRDVIAAYGRFPHRNAILGRTSSADEEDYLSRPGAGF